MNSVFILFGAVMLFLTGRRFFAPEAGLAAAALFALSPAVVFEAHILKPYCMSASFALACLYFSLKLLEAEPRPSDAAAAGAFLGLTAGSMPFFGIAAIAPFLSLLASRRLFSKYSFSVLIAAAAAFAATNPYWLLDARNLMFELTSFGSGREAPGPGLFAGYIFRQMPLGVSAAALLLAAAGVALAAAKKNAALLITAATGVVPVLLSAWILRVPELSIVNSRLLIPWIGMLALCAGSLLSRQFAPSGTAVYAARAAVAAAVVHSLLLSAVYVGVFRNESSPGSLRLAAGKWINGNIPAGSSIGVTALPEPTHVPPYEFTKYKTVLYLDDTAKDSPRYVVTTEDLPGLFKSPGNWTVLKRFEPGPEPFGLKLRYRAPGLFSPVTIYRRT